MRSPLYVGASGVIWALDALGRAGHAETSLDLQAAALRTRVPIVPVSIVGAEEIYPILGNARLLARLLGLPYFPLTPTFPWLGPLGMVPLPTVPRLDPFSST